MNGDEIDPFLMFGNSIVLFPSVVSCNIGCRCVKTRKERKEGVDRIEQEHLETHHIHAQLDQKKCTAVSHSGAVDCS